MNRAAAPVVELLEEDPDVWPYLWLSPQDFESCREIRKYLKIIGLYDKRVERWLSPK